MNKEGRVQLTKRVVFAEERKEFSMKTSHREFCKNIFIDEIYFIERNEPTNEEEQCQWHHFTEECSGMFCSVQLRVAMLFY